MSLVRRCDSCRAETAIPAMFGGDPDEWWYVSQQGGRGLSFCSQGCITDYYVSKRMIEGAM